MGGPYFFRARSTISIARSTPAQKPRGWARTTRIMLHLQRMVQRMARDRPRAAPKVRAVASDMARNTGTGNAGAAGVWHNNGPWVNAVPMTERPKSHVRVI